MLKNAEKKGFTSILKHWWFIPLFCQISGEVSKVQGTWFQARGAWFRDCGVHGFESTGYRILRVPGTGYRYIVSHYPPPPINRLILIVNKL